MILTWRITSVTRGCFTVNPGRAKILFSKATFSSRYVALTSRALTRPSCSYTQKVASTSLPCLSRMIFSMSCWLCRASCMGLGGCIIHPRNTNVKFSKFYFYAFSKTRTRCSKSTKCFLSTLSGRMRPILNFNSFTSDLTSSISIITLPIASL